MKGIGLMRYQLNKLILSSLIAATLIGCNGGSSDEGGATINPNKPVVNEIPTIALALDASGFLYQYKVEATDPNGDDLSFSVEDTPEWISIDSATGVISVDLTTAEPGTYTFNVLISDGENISKRTVQLHVALFTADLDNASPVVTQIPQLQAKTNYVSTFQIAATDPNSEDALSYSLSAAPDWISIEPTSGLVTMSPKAGDEGEMSFTIKVADGNTETPAAASVMVSYHINPETPDFENNAPIVDVIPLILAKTDRVVGERIKARDIDGDILTYSIGGNPSWVTVDQNGLIQVKAGEGQVGNHIFNAIVTDGVIDVSRSFQVKVELAETVPNNLPPSIQVIPTLNVDTETTLTYRVKAADANDDTLTFSLARQPEWASIDAKSGALSVSPSIWDDGTYVFDVVVSDGELEAKRSMTIVVKRVASANPMTQALATGDHSLVTEEQLLDYAALKLSDEAKQSKAIVEQLYKGVEYLTWNPSQHSKIIYGFSSKNRNTRVLVGNKHSNGSNANATFGLVGEKLSGQRYAYFGATTLSSVPHAPSNTFNDEIDQFSKNLFAWLLNTQNTSFTAENKINIVLSQMGDTYWAVVSWLEATYPEALLINSNGACDDDMLKACLDGKGVDLVIIGNEDFTTEQEQDFRDGYQYMEDHQIPFYAASKTHHIHSNSHHVIYDDIGISSIDTNWWDQTQAVDLTTDNILPIVDKRVDLLNNFKNASFDASALSACDTNFLSCTDAKLANTFKTGADLLRGEILYFDKKGIDIFSTKGVELTKAAILLGDKYRQGIDYPISRSESNEWFKAMYADWTVSYARAGNRAQPDLGNYVADNSDVVKGENAHYLYPETVTISQESSVGSEHQWTTTGWYALPGKPVTITRAGDDVHSIAVRLYYGRDKTNRAHEGTYRKHLEMSHIRLTIPAKGSVTFSTPYGAPIYIQHWGSNNGKPLSSSLTATGVAEHPSITDFSDPKQLERFEKLLNGTQLPHVDLKAPASEQHLRRDRFTGSINDMYPTVQALLTGIQRDHTEAIYSLAALKVQGKTLEQSTPAEVMTLCKEKFGAEDCTDERLHTRSGIQHANYDQNAQCGIGCAGNPWDSGYHISPRGWLDNHEMGHNFQTHLLGAAYVSEENRNNWASYARRDGENSNNIFPYYVLWKGYYVTDGVTETILDSHTNSKDIFYAFMSDAANLTNANGDRVIYYPGCSVAATGKTRHESIWSGNGYAENNSYRMSFYIQMALRADNLTMSDGSVLNTGFDIFPLLYQHARIYAKYAGNEAQWLASREKLGFGLFDHSTPHGAVGAISGNDFMLVSLSYMTGYDWTSHFELFGLRNSDLAKQQAAAHSIEKGALPMGMYVLETDLPKLEMTDELSFLALSSDNAVTLWTRDNSTPVNCGQ